MIRPDLIEHVIRPVVPEQFADDDYDGPRQPDRPRSCSAAPTPTPASPGARSSSTPTAAWPATAAAPSAARTPRRSTARPPTPPAGWPSTSSPSGAASRCEVQVAYAIGVAQPGVGPGRDVRHEPRSTRRAHRAGRPRGVRPAARRHHQRARTCASPIYRKTAAYGHFGRDEPGLHVGAAGQPRELQGGGRRLTLRRRSSAALRLAPTRFARQSVGRRCGAPAEPDAPVTVPDASASAPLSDPEPLDEASPLVARVVPDVTDSTSSSTTWCPTRGARTCASGRSCASAWPGAASAAGWWRSVRPTRTCRRPSCGPWPRSPATVRRPS